ncbi:MAG: hypothetical protein ABDH21_00875 [bacterium]
MDIIQINKLIDTWKQQLSKNDNYLILKTIQEIINVFNKLEQRQKTTFLNIFKDIQKKVFSQVYSNDPLIRRNVVILASTLESNDIVLDVLRYLKVEKDYENLITYLRYLEKFKSVGFIDSLSDYAFNHSLPLPIKIRVISIITSILPLYKGNQQIINKIFDNISEIINDPNNQAYIVIYYDNLISETMDYYTNKNQPKVVSIFCELYDSLIIRTMDLIKQIMKDKVKETQAELIAACIIFLLLAKALLEKMNYKGFSYEHYQDENIKYLLIKTIGQCGELFKFMINFSDKYNLTNEIGQIINQLGLSEYLVELLSNSNPRQKKDILKFLYTFGIKLSQDELKTIADLCKHDFDEDIISVCLDIFDHNHYYEDLHYFSKYSSSFSYQLREKIKNLIDKSGMNLRDG